jgi:Fur family ferric uptake transcriptional regulator
MAERREVDTLHLHHESYYRLCRDHHHHHHLVCRKCGKVVEFEMPGFEKWTCSKAASLGFRDVSHSLELFGICDGCQQDLACETAQEVH